MIRLQSIIIVLANHVPYIKPTLTYSYHAKFGNLINSLTSGKAADHTPTTVNHLIITD